MLLAPGERALAQALCAFGVDVDHMTLLYLAPEPRDAGCDAERPVDGEERSRDGTNRVGVKSLGLHTTNDCCWTRASTASIRWYEQERGWLVRKTHRRFDGRGNQGERSTAQGRRCRAAGSR
jgi:hypothetical protein